MRLVEDNPSSLSLLDIYKQVSVVLYILIIFIIILTVIVGVGEFLPNLVKRQIFPI